MITENIFWAILSSTVMATVVGVLLNWLKEASQNKSKWRMLTQEKLYGSLTYNLLMIKALEINRTELLEEISKEPTPDNAELILKKFDSVNPINNQWRQHIQNIKYELESKAGYIRTEHLLSIESFLDAYLKREITDGGKSRHATKERIGKIFDSIDRLQNEILSDKRTKNQSDIDDSYLGAWGLALSMIGTFYLAISSFEYTGMYVESIDGRQFHSLLLDSALFKMSLWIIGVGFLVQLLEKVLDNVPKNYRKILITVSYWFSILLLLYVSAYRYFGIF